MVINLERNVLKMDAMSLRMLISYLLLVLTGCAGSYAGQPQVVATVAGKVAAAGVALADVKVMAFPLNAISLQEPAPLNAPVTAADGRFRLDLPPGDYFLLARGGGYFSYYGRNPVTVPATGLTEVNLGLVAVVGGGSSDIVPEVETGIAGKVVHDNRPLAGAMIHVYTDLSDGLKGMGYVMAGPTDDEGYFEVSLPAGTYYLLARLRRGASGMTGPLQAGDYIGYFPGNPLRIREGQVARISIPLLEVPEKIERMTDSLFGNTAIHGRILHADGRPVSGARAVLYGDAQMLNRPLFVSRPTAADGTFVLSFPHGGTYYLAARNTLGGAPGPGDLYGTYAGTPDHALQVNDGEQLRGVELVVEEMW